MLGTFKHGPGRPRCRGMLPKTVHVAIDYFALSEDPINPHLPDKTPGPENFTLAPTPSVHPSYPDAVLAVILPW